MSFDALLKSCQFVRRVEQVVYLGTTHFQNIKSLESWMIEYVKALFLLKKKFQPAWKTLTYLGNFTLLLPAPHQIGYKGWSSIRGSFKNCFLRSIKPHDLESILSTSYFYSFTLEGLYIIF